MTLHYCASEKSAVICAEIEEGVSDLLAGGSARLWGLHTLTFLPGSESILAAAGLMAGMVLVLLTQERANMKQLQTLNVCISYRTQIRLELM